MGSAFRATLAIVGAVAAFYFALWAPGSLLQRVGLPLWTVVALSLALSVLACRFIWRSLPAAKTSPARSADKPQRAMILGALLVGAVGFAGGFLGPMMMTPGANQGPLLGMFITGPLGAVLGAGLGWFWWATYKGPGNRDEDSG